MSDYAPGTEPIMTPPPVEIEVPPANFKQVGKQVGQGVKEAGIGDDFLLKAQVVVAEQAAKLLNWFLLHFMKIISYLAGVLLKAREGLEPGLSKLASLALSDLFGTPVNEGAFQRMGDAASRAQMAELVGTQLLNGLTGNIAGATPGQIVPTDGPAKNYVTKMADLAVQGWFEKIVMGIVSEHPFENIGELQDVVTKVFGIERISRSVVRPLVDAVVVTPFEWKVNKDYRPKLLTAAQIIEQFYRGRWTREEVSEELARQGFSDRRIDAMVNGQYPSQAVTDILLFVEAGQWTEDVAVAAMLAQGVPETEARNKLLAVNLRKAVAAREDYMRASTAAYIDRKLDYVTFSRDIDMVGMVSPERDWYVKAASLKRELNYPLMSEGDAEQAVKRGFWTFTQYTDYLHLKAFSDDDITTKMLLLQDAIQLDEAAKEKREALEKQRADEKAARDAEAKQRRAELDEQRSHKDLSIATVERAYVRGRLTLDQYREFLEKDKQASDDIQTLLNLAAADRADYEEAGQKREMANRKLSATSLTMQQLEKAVELGDLTIDDWRGVLTQQGIEGRDLDILQHELQVNLQERVDAAKRRAEIEAKLAVKTISLDQVERAVRRGLKSMTEYTTFLAGQGYGVEDQGVLVGLLQATIDDEEAARQKRADIEAALKIKKISLADMERAVRRGVRPIADYRALLVASGLALNDVDTLVALLEDTIAQDELAREKQAEIEAKVGVRRVALNDVARAVRLGLVPIALYQEALNREKMPADDQQIMLSLLGVDIDDTAAAKAARAAAEEKTKNRPVPLSEVAKAVRQGLRSIGEYQGALLREGYATDAVDLMVSVLQEELDQLAAAKAKREELDAKKTEPELTRAELERAVKAGVRQIPDYRQYLVDQGYDLIARITLENLLLSEMGMF